MDRVFLFPFLKALNLSAILLSTEDSTPDYLQDQNKEMCVHVF